MRMSFSVLSRLVFCLALVSWVCIGIASERDFHQGCEVHLQRAAHSLSPEFAVKELAKSLAYLRENDMTRGDVPELQDYGPGSDVGLWYRNLVKLRNELAAAKPDDPEGVRAQLMLKASARLLLRDKDGDAAVYLPSDLSWHIHSAAYRAAGACLAVLLLGGLLNASRRRILRHQQFRRSATVQTVSAASCLCA